MGRVLSLGQDVVGIFEAVETSTSSTTAQLHRKAVDPAKGTTEEQRSGEPAQRVVKTCQNKNNSKYILQAKVDKVGTLRELQALQIRWPFLLPDTLRKRCARTLLITLYIESSAWDC